MNWSGDTFWMGIFVARFGPILRKNSYIANDWFIRNHRFVIQFEFILYFLRFYFFIFHDLPCFLYVILVWIQFSLQNSHYKTEVDFFEIDFFWSSAFQRNYQFYHDQYELWENDQFYQYIKPWNVWSSLEWLLVNILSINVADSFVPL